MWKVRLEWLENISGWGKVRMVCMPEQGNQEKKGLEVPILCIAKTAWN